MALQEEKAALENRVRELIFKLEVRKEDLEKKEVGRDDSVLWCMLQDA